MIGHLSRPRDRAITLAEPTRTKWRVTFSKCAHCGDNVARNPATGEWEHVPFLGETECDPEAAPDPKAAP